MDSVHSTFSCPEALNKSYGDFDIRPKQMSSEYSQAVHGNISANESKKFGLMKRICDLLFGSVLLIIASPIVAISWVVVRVASSGPGFYSQVRVGIHGRQFRIYKLRTMTHNCEAMTGGAKWSTAGDSRITGVGKVLRKLHIDELPQLFNVILGHMSLVGPRPERPEFVTPLSLTLPNYLSRLIVKPGVTGLAQIQLPPDSDIESVRRKLVLDICYINDRSINLDLRLMFGTMFYLAGFKYSVVKKIFKLPNPLVDQWMESQVRGDVMIEIPSDKSQSVEMVRGS